MSQIVTRNSSSLQINWQKELANVITDPEQLLLALDLNPADYQQQIQARRLFPMRVPRYFVGLMQPKTPNDPLLRQVLPDHAEFLETAGFSNDPLEEQQSAIPGLLHKYHNRVLLVVRGGCAINCRYCFRRHFPYQDNAPGSQGWQAAIDYIAEREEINEVIFSGGDPLMANDHQLEKLITALAEIPHLKRLRIHTRLPVVLPYRLTDKLTELLTQTRLQTILVTHINHAQEIGQELTQRLLPLQTGGVWLLNQSVLLKGVNDSAQTLADLSEALFDNQIKPYYLHLLDRVQGAAHFEVSLDDAKVIMRKLYELLPGFLVPRLVREEAHKPSKTPQDLGLG